MRAGKRGARPSPAPSAEARPPGTRSAVSVSAGGGRGSSKPGEPSSTGSQRSSGGASAASHGVVPRGSPRRGSGPRQWPRCWRMRSTTAGSSIGAMIFLLPPQRGQDSGSTSRTFWMSWRQVLDRTARRVRSPPVDDPVCLALLDVRAGLHQPQLLLLPPCTVGVPAVAYRTSRSCSRLRRRHRRDPGPIPAAGHQPLSGRVLRSCPPRSRTVLCRPGQTHRAHRASRVAGRAIATGRDVEGE